MNSVLKAGKPYVPSPEPMLVSEGATACALFETDGCFHIYKFDGAHVGDSIWTTIREPEPEGAWHLLLNEENGGFAIHATTAERIERIWRADLDRHPEGPPFHGELHDDGDLWLYDASGVYWKASQAPNIFSSSFHGGGNAPMPNPPASPSAPTSSPSSKTSAGTP